MVRVAFSALSWLGVKVRLMLQEPPAGTEGTQLSLSAKSGLFKTMLAMFNATDARFVRVTF